MYFTFDSLRYEASQIIVINIDWDNDALSENIVRIPFKWKNVL